MKYIYILLLLILSGCTFHPDIDYINAKQGKELAEKQDVLFQKYTNNEYIAEREADSLSNNVWFYIASQTAPSNLVIRQMVLIDIIRKKPEHGKQIDSLLSLLSCGGELYLEGYSYWRYTEPSIRYWVHEFLEEIYKYNMIKNVNSINLGFIITAYKRDNVYYPAPYGDLRDEPLSEELQRQCMFNKFKSVQHSFIELDVVDDSNFVYKMIEARPIGLNTHIFVEPHYIEFINGKSNFTFYNGYDKKYGSKKEELKDLFDKRRLETLK